MYLTVLWSKEDGRDQPAAFDIKNHEELQKAVIYLVKNGAKFENQEIVKKVDWMPKGNLSSTENKTHSGPSGNLREEDPGPPPGTIPGKAEQPAVINNPSAKIPQKKRSMFDGVIPQNILNQV